MAEKKKSSLRDVVAVLVAAALVFLGSLLGECGLGTGLGPGLKAIGDGATPASTTAATAAPAPTVSAAPSASAAPPASCQLRLDKEGLKVDGELAAVAAAVEACKKVGKAELLATGDASYGEHEKLRAALHEAGIFVLERAP